MKIFDLLSIVSDHYHDYKKFYLIANAYQIDFQNSGKTISNADTEGTGL